MGLLLRVEACPVCNYHIESELYYGGSTRTRLFIHFQYLLAHCHACRNVVSVLVPLSARDLAYKLDDARRDIERLEAMAERGDVIARRLLGLHRVALIDDDSLLQDLPVGLCTVCSSSDVTVFEHLGGDEGEHFSDGTAWLECPRCDEGKLWVRAVGTWDEIDNGL
ncbi:MAG: hypothetical protein Kow0077_01790 [Anaerolineae bacterium]